MSLDPSELIFKTATALVDKTGFFTGRSRQVENYEFVKKFTDECGFGPRHPLSIEAGFSVLIGGRSFPFSAVELVMAQPHRTHFIQQLTRAGYCVGFDQVKGAFVYGKGCESNFWRPVCKWSFLVGYWIFALLALSPFVVFEARQIVHFSANGLSFLAIWVVGVGVVAWKLASCSVSIKEAEKLIAGQKLTKNP